MGVDTGNYAGERTCLTCGNWGKSGSFAHKLDCPYGTKEHDYEIRHQALQEALEAIGEDEGYSAETPENQYYWLEQNEKIEEANQIKQTIRDNIKKLLEGA